jgi:hypothetical protein
VETLTDRGRDAGHDVDFLPIQPVLETGADLVDVLPLLNARVDAERIVPANTAAFLDRIGLRVDRDGAEPRLVRS